MSETKTRADRLLAAHVAFERAQWRGDEGAARVTQWIDVFWRWADETTLEAVVDVDTVRAAAERLALDMPLPDDLAAVIGSLADDLVRLEVNRETRVQDVIDQSLFDDGVSLFIELENLRTRLIKRVLDSPIYAALASDVLYQGIKDYIFSDSGALRSLPGVSRLIKGSSSAVGKRLPGLEAQVEKRVRAYIENNTAKTLARSEAYLLDSLDQARIRALAAEIWSDIHAEPLSVADAIDADDLQRLVDFGLRVWAELRETEYVAALIDEGVQAYFKHHGGQKLSTLMAHVGLDRDLLLAEAQTLAPDIIAGLDTTGLLETLIREQLAPFYASDEFRAAVNIS